MTTIDRQLELTQIRFQTLYNLTKMIDRPEQEILDFALEAGVTVTDSDIGYIYFANHDETKLYLHAWSKNVMPQCSVESFPDAYLVSETGLWGEAVRQRKPIITNDYHDSPYKKGYPDGHVPVRNHMNLPVFDNNKIVIIAGVGNKNGNYTDEDVQQLSLIMDGMWNIVKRKRVEDELRNTNENLEKLIEERTQQLQTANEELHYIIEKQGHTEAVLAKSEAVFRGVFDNAAAGIMLFTADGNIRMANRISAQLLGFTQKELTQKNITDLLHPDSLDDALNSIEHHLKNNDTTWHHERKLITKDRKPLWANLNITVLRSSDGSIESLIVVATDITARVLAEHELLKNTQALNRSREQLQVIIDSVPALISYIDRNLCYQFVNKQYQVMYDIHPNDLIGRHVKTIIGEKTFDRVKNRYEKVLEGIPQRYEMPYSNLGKDYILDVSYIPHQFEGSIDGIFILVMDVTERKKLEQHLELLSITDPLTGAKNRRFFMDNAQKEIGRSFRYKSPLSLIMLDIDHFKRINDTCGHDAGDEVLKMLVKTAESVLRKSDLFSRMGGEEFAAILLETNLQKAQTIAERLRQTIQELNIQTSEGKVNITVSIGLTELNTNEKESLDIVMKRADRALYNAKKAGRNQTAVMALT